MKIFKVLLLSVMLSCLFVGSSNATPVDLELSLLLDVSGSINSSEFNLQKQGYINAFNNANLWNAVSQGAMGKIAVNFIYWSGRNQQSEAVGWTLIDSQQAAFDFATAIGATSRPYGGATAVQSALRYSTDLFANAYEGTRSVIDISGDGVDNDSPAGLDGKNYALTNGVNTINGIVIGNSGSVLSYYNNSVIGGTNAFSMQVNSFADFGTAIDKKLIREISNVPEPSTILLMGAGLLGLVGLNRKRSKRQA